MKRGELLQNLIDHSGYERYLEIGVHKGRTFFPLKCRYKTAVDPAFRIHPYFFLGQLRKNPFNFRNRYYQVTSDKFFQERMPERKPENYFDLIFIDGLHTFRASLTDVLNALKYLKPEGTIVLHDCFPPNEAAATPAESLADAQNMNIDGWSGAWCGDVWKTVVYLKRKYSEALEIKVLNSDMGLGIIKVKHPTILRKELDPILFNSVNIMDYRDLQKNPKNLINLSAVEELQFS